MDIRSYLDGERLVLLQVFYRMPDYRSLIQEFMWQLMDLPPAFPKMNRFLTYWDRNLDGKIVKVYFSVDNGLSNWRKEIQEFKI